MALAVLGDSTKYEILIVTSWTELADRRVDFLDMATHTMGRDVYEATTQSGLQFSTPFIYVGLVFGGVPEFVDCADNLEAIEGTCRQLKICVTAWATYAALLEDLLPATHIVAVSELDDFVTLFQEGKCNVIARDTLSLPSESELHSMGYTGPFTHGSKVFSREPIAMVSRDEDPAWSDLLNLVVQLFLHAEASNLTQIQAAELLLESHNSTLGEQSLNIESLMIKLVAEFGNYGELYERTIEDIIPRDGLRQNSTGLMHYFPFGNLQTRGDDPVPGSMLETILTRGHLICGVIPRPGFAERHDESDVWTGFDVEFCKTLNAAIHIGSVDNVEYVDVSNATRRFSFLQTGRVDVIAGEHVTLQKDFRERSTGVGYAFSPPTFFDDEGNAFAFATKQDDTQFSSFVYWVVMALVYAEDRGLSQANNELTKMPVVNLFGQHLKQMFLDSLSATGNYGEIYERTLGNLIPRAGGNQLNCNFSQSQMFAVPID